MCLCVLCVCVYFFFSSVDTAGELYQFQQKVTIRIIGVIIKHLSDLLILEG